MSTSYTELNLGELLKRHPELQISHTDYNINVTANFGTKLSSGDAEKMYQDFDGAGKPSTLYFHVPLCSYICHFCNYVKKYLPEDGNEEEVLENWVNLLIKESTENLHRNNWVSKARIESIYIGGGTASLLKPHHLRKLMTHIKENYYIADGCEVSLEGNPDNYQGNELAEAIEMGFNRFSIGVQSLDDQVINAVGRKHDRAMSLSAIDKLLVTEKPFNVDVIFGLPYQTPMSIAEDVRILCEKGVPTITIYRLRNADRQKMGIGNSSLWNNKRVREKMENANLFPSLEMTYTMREEILKVFLEYGYQPSPCGWWSRPDTYAEGNIPQISKNKWERYDSMIAYGPGVYGWLTGGQDTVLQTHNISDIGKYVEAMESNENPLSFGRLLEGNQAISTALGFNYKANQPIKVERYQKQFGVNLLTDTPYAEVISSLIENRLLLKVDENTLIPTLDGEALHEEIISIYFHNKIGNFTTEICNK
ncbi:radical SAM protein [Alkalihalophilus pseudofirmus]|uniref:radical SAM protein n=1 Tax=Alkalihalophilus pseudofirmus TaxID=79885 RepID=UPI00259BD181|nr:radical SAM protein [Alkalihalophilus pseudofirmus]WEG16687.1 radical SAM protein [Alkalihalophilus pseudofirmus]